MRTLWVREVSPRSVLDVVTLSPVGQLDYATGSARDIFEGKRVEGMSDTALFERMDGWSNGYVMVGRT